MKSRLPKIAMESLGVALMLALGGCFSARKLDFGDAFVAALQPMGEAVLVSALAQEHRKSTGQWPTNVAEFSEAASKFAMGFGATNGLRSSVPSVQNGLADLKLVPLTNGSLSISYRALAPTPNSNALTMNIVVTADGHTSLPDLTP
jgi:hypothetical protein